MTAKAPIVRLSRILKLSEMVLEGDEFFNVGSLSDGNLGHVRRLMDPAKLK